VTDRLYSRHRADTDVKRINQYFIEYDLKVCAESNTP